ncbi:Putative pterin-4-alpha-carbinolamine dehydratase [Mycobacterium basiliense]|uniref:Putative pterin-4-alpha-carbinolamine dehydratase n=1 Tax=Mycobacterium basiliense TaxID=2094119 RepID=A0A3S4BS61_9MYCO|nr:Putative pterin-4-alpha-carbinolamine dehydratase [Mycobacterium basiliense]
MCDGQLSALTTEEVAVRLGALCDWDLRNGRLERTFRCRNFAESVGFVNQLAQIAEDLNHHPNFWVIDKRRVSVVIWTHKMNCLTKLDFDLAASIGSAYDELTAAVSS